MDILFSTWMNNKFLDWQKEKGSRQTLSEFAEYLGVPQSNMSSWVNGRYKPGTKYIPILAEYFGDEIYNVLGLKSPSKEEISISKLPTDVRERLHSAITEINETLLVKGLDPESIEAAHIVEQIFEKHGFTSSPE
jgi:transcriptional regulator with XRE-family HTH domain